MTTSNNRDIVAFIETLAETGSNYRMERMDDLYTDDLAFLGPVDKVGLQIT